MSVAEKKAGIRICIDPRPLNEVLKREHYKLPVLDDVLPELTSACKFFASLATCTVNLTMNRVC